MSCLLLRAEVLTLNEVKGKEQRINLSTTPQITSALRASQ